MILQELIRNFILYREVVTPMLVSWKDSFAANYYREKASKRPLELTLTLQAIKSRDGGEELGWDISDDYEQMTLARATGTRTITDKKLIYQNNSEARVFWRTASVSKKILILLTNSGVVEKTINIGKTDQFASTSSSSNVILATKTVTVVTTGFENKQIKSFLRSETHEKREYLGEFSLTHEEIPLIAFSERRCVS